MDDMVIMGGLDAHTRLNGYTDCFFYGKTCFFLDIFFEGDSFHQLHDNIMDAVVLTNIINIYNVGMHQACRSLGLHPEFGYKI